MRKCIIIVALALCLTGCSSVPTWETLGSIDHSSPSLPPKQAVALELPEEAAEDVWVSEEETMYTCDGYSVYLRTFPSGDLTGTIKTLSGYRPEQLTVMKSSVSDTDRYDWVWSAVGDAGDLICRAAVLDDGNYHYSLCVIAASSQAGELAQEWNELFASFCLEQ